MAARPEAGRRAAARARAELFPWEATVAAMTDLHRWAPDFADIDVR